MTEFKIHDSDFASLRGKTIVVTGGSSGIGLATVQLLLATGSAVVAGDLNPPPIDPVPENLTFVTTDVTAWSSLLNLFTTAATKHGKIDHVFANAGIGPRTDFFASTLSPTGELLEPTFPTMDVNLRAMMNTVYIGLHHFRTQQAAAVQGGKPYSIVCTASASSFQPFSPVDYTTSKHAILGLVRAVVPNLATQQAPVRINAIGPSWTHTGIVNDVAVAAITAAGGKVQSAEVVARNVALLFADEARNGQFVYSAQGRYWEVEESVFAPAAKRIVGVVEEGLEGDIQEMRKAREEGVVRAAGVS